MLAPWALALACTAAAVPDGADAKRRPDRRVVYKATVTFTGTHDERILAPGGALVLQAHRVTTWKARSGAFLLLRHETPAGKLLSYSTRPIGAGLSPLVPLVGTLRHRGKGKANQYAPSAECWRDFTEKEPDGLGPVKGSFSLVGNALSIALAWGVKGPTQAYAAVTCPSLGPGLDPERLPAEKNDCWNCLVYNTPPHLSDEQRLIKFGRAFTLPINWDPISDESLFIGDPNGSWRKTSYYWKIRFRPVRQ